MLVFSLLSPMGEREAQVSQPGTGRAEWGWREDPKVKSKPEAGHKGPRGFGDTSATYRPHPRWSLPPPGRLPLNPGGARPKEMCGEDVPRASRWPPGCSCNTADTPHQLAWPLPAARPPDTSHFLQVCLQKCPLHQSLYPQTSTPQSFIATSFIFLVIPFYHLAGFIFLVYLICYFHR